LTFCSKCGKENPPNALYCNNCGNPLTPLPNETNTKYCSNCGAQIDKNAEICPKCGVRVAPPPMAAAPAYRPERKSAGLAAVLSFLFVGLGQIYNGQIGKGIMFIILGIVFVFMMLLLIGFILYPLFWIYNIYDAYSTAERINAS
jgi:TM2 domain-containing membrane protein YozV/ribosomal protein L40E